MDLLRKMADVVAPVLAAVMIYAAVAVVPAAASVNTADRLIDLQAAAQDRSMIEGFLARDDVRRQMIDLGVDPAEIGQRVNALSDPEARAIANKINETPASQGAAGVLVVTAVLLFVVLTVPDMVSLSDETPALSAQAE